MFWNEKIIYSSINLLSVKWPLLKMSALMLSPKMQQRIQRGVRINDGQLLGIAEKAKYDSRKSGYLYKRSSDGSKWLRRWFRLYQVGETETYFVWASLHYIDIIMELFNKNCSLATFYNWLVEMMSPRWIRYYRI